MLNKRSEKGQAIVLIVFSIIGIIGLTALTVDGGLAYADRRSAQGAADSAAWAGGLANARGDGVSGIRLAAEAVADQNGYTGDGARSEVIVEVIDDPSGLCPAGASPNRQITVTINSNVDTFFAPVIGVEEVTNTVTAVTRACGTRHAGIFGGNAVVGLNSSGTDCAYDSGNSNSTKWIIKNGGISSNGCAFSKNAASVTFDPGYCVSAAGGAQGGFVGKECAGTPVPYPQEYIDSIMPPNPCTGSVSGGVYAGGGIVPSNGQSTFNNGVYCISNMDSLDKKDVILNNATLYVTDMSFDLKFAGGGGFSGTPSNSGAYSSLYMVVAQTTTSGANNCDQNMEYRGNGSGIAYGTFLAPTSCIDWRGNSATTIKSQLIGYNITGNGTADLTIDYKEDQNYRPPESPTIILVK
jgi:hypothetical protein